MAVAVGGPGGAAVGVGSSRQPTGATPGRTIGVLGEPRLIGAALGPQAAPRRPAHTRTVRARTPGWVALRPFRPRRGLDASA